MLGKDKLVFRHPLLNLARSSQERFWMLAFVALLAIIQSAITDKGVSLIVAASALVGAVTAELTVTAIKEKPGIRDASCFATALILTIMLPNDINPVLPALGAFFAIIVVKESFGGLGTNWLNPALGGWLFLLFSFPGLFQDALQNSPLEFLSRWISEAPPLNSGTDPVSILSSNGFGTQNGDFLTSFLNTHVFSIFDVELPGNYFDFFSNPGAGIIADRGGYGLLIGSIVLVATKSHRLVMPLIYAVIFMALTAFDGALPFGGTIWGGDMLFGLLTGGVLVAAFFLTADPSSSPKSISGKIAFAALAAAFTYFLRYIKGENYGAFFAVAALNTVNPVIRIVEDRFFRSRLSRKEALT